MDKRQRNGDTKAQTQDGGDGVNAHSTNQADDGRKKLFVGMEFESQEAAKDMYESYARRAGFNTNVGQYSRDKPDGPIVSWELFCSREVYRRNNLESCNAMLRIEKNDSGCWAVTKFVEDHNHSIGNLGKVHFLRPRRHFAGAAKSVLPETADNPNDIMGSLDGNHVFYDPNRLDRNTSPAEANSFIRNTSPGEINPVVRTASSVETNHATSSSVPVLPLHFIKPSSRRRYLGRDARNLLTYFRKMQAENPGFFYAVQLDDDNRLSNVFLADGRSRTAYHHFGDAVTFDTMYRPNQFQVPFALFTGVNNHGQMVLFGCALLLDESEASFAWVFKTWLSAMNNQPPVSITTDQDRAIKAAIHQVFLETRHCICKWHISLGHCFRRCNNLPLDEISLASQNPSLKRSSLRRPPRFPKNSLSTLSDRLVSRSISASVSACSKSVSVSVLDPISDSYIDSISALVSASVHVYVINSLSIYCNICFNMCNITWF